MKSSSIPNHFLIREKADISSLNYISKATCNAINGMTDFFGKYALLENRMEWKQISVDVLGCVKTFANCCVRLLILCNAI